MSFELDLECCICLESKLITDIITYSCGHNNVCANCFILQNYNDLTAYNDYVCPMCENKTSYTKLKFKIDISKCVYYIESKELFKILKYCIKSFGVVKSNEIIQRFLEIYSYFNTEKLPVLLSVSETEELLMLAKENYLF